jgi:hypothetical protein
LPDIESNWLDLHDVIKNKKYDTYNNISKDMFNDYVNEGINKIVASVIDDRIDLLSFKSLNIIGSMVWFKAIHTAIHLLQFDDPLIIKGYTVDKLCDILTKMKYLQTLTITSGSLNVGKLLQKLPNLKHLTLSGYYDSPIDIDIKDIHKLETFCLLRPFQQKNSDIFKKLTNLRNLTIITENEDQQLNSKTISEIIKLKHLDNLVISISNLSMITELTNLKYLGLINCLVTNDDLLKISSMKNIKNIDFIENIKDPLYTDWTDHMSYFTEYREFMTINERHNEKDIENFSLLRPDIKINYKDDILNATKNDSLREVYYSLDY